MALLLLFTPKNKTKKGCAGTCNIANRTKRKAVLMLTRDLEAKRNVKVCIFFVFLSQEKHYNVYFE